MNTIKYQTAIVFVTLLFCVSSFAQQIKPQSNTKSKSEMTVASPNSNQKSVSPEKQNAIKGIMKIYSTELEKMRQNNMSNDARNAKIIAINKNRDEALKKVMTPAQFNGFQNVQQQLNARLAERMKNKNNTTISK